MKNGVWYDHNHNEIFEIKFSWWLWTFSFNGADMNMWLICDDLIDWFEKNAIYLGEL